MARAVDVKYELSEDLEELLDTSKRLTRGQVIKGIWKYATDNDLKTSKKYKGRNTGAIKSDYMLKFVIGSGVVAAPEIMKRIGDHLFR